MRIGVPATAGGLERNQGTRPMGWIIFAYRYYHNRPFLQPRLAQTELVKAIHDSFQAPDWGMSEQTDRCY
jgi:hypothetical protein